MNDDLSESIRMHRASGAPDVPQRNRNDVLDFLRTMSVKTPPQTWEQYSREVWLWSLYKVSRGED